MKRNLHFSLVFVSPDWSQCDESMIPVLVYLRIESDQAVYPMSIDPRTLHQQLLPLGDFLFPTKFFQPTSHLYGIVCPQSLAMQLCWEDMSNLTPEFPASSQLATFSISYGNLYLDLSQRGLIFVGIICLRAVSTG